VFVHREGLSRTREFIIFVTLSVIGLGLNEAIMWLGGRLVGDGWYMLTKVVATALVMFWNFFSRKRWLDAGWGSTPFTMRTTMPCDLWRGRRLRRGLSFSGCSCLQLRDCCSSQRSIGIAAVDACC
jgi:hypothetical protein